MSNEQRDDVHPLRAWRLKLGYDYETVARLAAVHGAVLAPRYIEAIEMGWRHPRYIKAEALSKATNGSVTTHTIMTWPLRAA